MDNIIGIRSTPASRKKFIGRCMSQVVLIIVGIIFIYPFFWMVSTSLKTVNDASSLSLNLIPKVIAWENYQEIFKIVPFHKYIVNTTFLAVINMIGQVLTSSMVAYAMSHINWKGKKYIFPLILSTLLLPYQVTMIPVYIIYRNLNLVGTFLPLIIPAFTAGAMNVFLMRQFFMSIPHSLVQAAEIDGANNFKIYYKIILPLSKPVLTAVAVFTLLFTWSDFMGPLIYLNDPEKFTMSIGLKAFIGEHSVKWQLIMAASTVATVPMIVLFFFAQKQFIEGITLTGIKG